MTRGELIEKVARAIRLSHFKQIGKSHICDDTLPLSDDQLAEARAAVDIVLEEAARVATAAINSCREDGESDLRAARSRVQSAIRALKEDEE
jgi:hypothetical protein